MPSFGGRAHSFRSRNLPVRKASFASKLDIRHAYSSTKQNNRYTACCGATGTSVRLPSRSNVNPLSGSKCPGTIHLDFASIVSASFLLFTRTDLLVIGSTRAGSTSGTGCSLQCRLLLRSALQTLNLAKERFPQLLTKRLRSSLKDLVQHRVPVSAVVYVPPT